ncbi:MAG: cation:proton antiporter [Cephaloticoccus sp.]|nr:cation:proton antiporter [Cephaloticoccus sp.]MCF7760351.1 cation:proton antiporter [Cephaloticoccus sp.]
MHGIDFIQDLAVVVLVAGLVGWACQRAGLSVVVGYLVAGMAIGPFNLPVAMVSNIERIETLSQMGLVFLMFSIGMKLSLRKLRKLGLALVLATIIEAVIISQLARATGGLMGLGSVETVFLGAMLMISSSAVIIKVLADIGATHEKAGQMAMGVFVVEDVIAVLLLTGLSSYATLAGVHAESATFSHTLLLLTAFVVLVGIVGVLVVPWLLRKLSLTGGVELPTLVQVGLLFVLATAAQRAGFSLALGAFLLGAIVADTPQRTQVDRTFEGLRDVFSAVFFVAIGMLIDVSALFDVWGLVLVVAALALLGRALACATGLLITGSRTAEAVRVGLLVVPIGEFTFIIAQLGIAGGVLPKSFQAVAVGAALVTTFAAPLLARRSSRMADWCARREPEWLSTWLRVYRGWLERLRIHEARNMLWQLSKKRLIQIGVELLLVTGLFAFSGPLFALMLKVIPPDWLFPYGPQILYWSGITLLSLAPLVAIWRNLSALAMLVAEVVFASHPTQAPRFAPMLELALKMVGGLMIFLLLSSFLPLSGGARWVPVVVVAVVAVVVGLFRRKLIYWHSVLEVELQERLAQPVSGGTSPGWLAPHKDWNITLAECVLPDLADVRGRTLGELQLRTRIGCTVAGVERQGVLIETPPADFALYPCDRVLLLGNPEQTAIGKAFITRVSGTQPTSGFDDVRMETVVVPGNSGLANRTLAELAPTHQVGVQVTGIHRQGVRILNPGGEEKLLPHDEVLLLGTETQISAFASWAVKPSTATEP